MGDLEIGEFGDLDRGRGGGGGGKLELEVLGEVNFL